MREHASKPLPPARLELPALRRESRLLVGSRNGQPAASRRWSGTATILLSANRKDTALGSCHSTTGAAATSLTCTAPSQPHPSLEETPQLYADRRV